MKRLFLLALGVTMLVDMSAAHADWYRGGWRGGWRGPGWGYYPHPFRYYVSSPVYYAPPPASFPPILS
jgi:hypothetical protein